MSTDQIAAEAYDALSVSGNASQRSRQKDIAIIQAAIKKAYLQGKQDQLQYDKTVDELLAHASEQSLSRATNNLGRHINKILEDAGHNVSMDTMLRIMAVIESRAVHASELERLYPHTGTCDSTGHGQPL